MSTCTNLIKGIVAECDALNKVGGVKPRIYIGQLSQLLSGGFTTDSDENIDTITLVTASPVNTLKKFEGKKLTSSASFPLTAGENVNLFNHTVALAIFYSTSEQLLRIEQLANAEDLFAIVEGNDGKLMVFGINEGLNASAGEGGTGIQLQDSTAYILTLTGDQSKTPRYFMVSPTATLADNLSYLDAIAEA